MTAWAPYAAAWAAFLLSHALPVRPAARARLVGLLGPRGFTLAYSAVSLAALTGLVVAAGRAPQVVLWDWAPWQRTVAQAAMGAACVLVAMAAGTPNPLSFGGWRNDRFDPARPGIVGWLRHPWLAALALWAAAHVPVNGDLAHVVMFGGFAVFAVAGMAMIDRRRRRDLGPAAWRGLRAGRGHLPRDWPLRAAAGGGLWLALALAHPAVIGPTVWP